MRKKPLSQMTTDDEWMAQWGRWFDVTVRWLYRGEPEPERPEKPWHILAYGAGRHSREAEEWFGRL